MEVLCLEAQIWVVLALVLKEFSKTIQKSTAGGGARVACIVPASVPC